MVGLVLYISSINDEMLNRTKDAETYFSYKYGWSFAFAAISFLLTEVNPVHPAGWRAGHCPGSAGGERHFTHILDPATLLPYLPTSPECVTLTFPCLLHPGRPRALLLSSHPLPSTLQLVSRALSCADPAGSKARTPAVSSPLLPPHCRVLGLCLCICS